LVGVGTALWWAHVPECDDSRQFIFSGLSYTGSGV
jgi:hypothetical protein